MSDATKPCRVCRAELPLDAFGPDGRAFDGRSSRCRECRNAAQRKYARHRLETDPAFREQRARYWKKFRAEQGSEWARQRNRRHKLALYYGITPEQYDELLAAQGGRCAICRGTQTDADVRKRYLAVDHDHVTGRVRGLLCENCNFGLGKFLDDPDLLDLAAAYLRRSP